MVESAEDALEGARVEYVAESTAGTPPNNPAWSKWSDAVAAHPGWEPDAGIESPLIVGEVDPPDHWRGPESHTIAIQYWMQQFFTDGAGTAQVPGGELITYDGSNLPSYTIVTRQVSSDGGNDSAGYRDYTVAVGCRPTSLQSPGEPDSGSPITIEEQLLAERVRSIVIHQPSASTTLTVSGLDTGVTLTLEDEGASTTEDVTADGTTTASFADIDAAYLDGENSSDVTVTDGSGTTLVTIPGIDTDGVEGSRGVPALGTGSHATDLGSNYIQSLAVESDYGTGEIATRVHGLDLSIDVNINEDPIFGDSTRRQSKDPGERTVECEADTAGEFNSHDQLVRYFQDTTGDLDYIYKRGSTEVGTVTVNAARVVEIDEKNFEAGDPAIQFSVTFAGQGDPSTGTAAVTTSTP